MKTRKAKLTKSVVDALQPEAVAYRVWDTKEPGYFVRVTPNGAKAFAMRYRNGGRNLDYTIGRYPDWTEARARAKATEQRGKAKTGSDLLADRKADKTEEAAARAKAKQDRKEAREQAKRAKFETLGGFIEHQYTPYAEANLRGHAEQLRMLNVDFKSMHALPLSQITQWSVQKWAADQRKAGHKRKAGQGLQASSINRRITALKAALSMAVEWGVIEASPLRGMKRIKTDDVAKPRFLSADEESRLRTELDARQDRQRDARERFNAWRIARHIEPLPPLDGAFTDHMKPLVVLALNTGMRRGELFNLAWRDVDLHRRIVTVAGGGAKSGRTRHIPLNDEAFAVLTAWRNQSDANMARVFPSPVTGERLDNINTAWREVVKQAKLPDFRFHDLRHTFASNLVMRGADLTTVRELLGHADIETTLRYAHLAPEHRAAAVALLGKPKPEATTTATGASA